MDCARTRFFLNAYLDGELAECDRRQVAQHLSRCERCAARLDSFRRVRAILKDRSPRQTAPADLRRRIARMQLPSKRRAWRPAAAAAALCLLVIPVVADSISRSPGERDVLKEKPVERVLHGRIFCLRCALSGSADLPPASKETRPHLAAFRDDDGQVWILLNREACPESYPTGEVAMAGRYFPSSHVVAAESIR
ncbi:MAG: anti-sigma factor family protein [Thermoanaerobaculia bacterium]